MATVTVSPSGRTFACDGKQTILEAALSASVSLQYGCSIGTCGRCKVRLVDGEIEKVKHHDYTIRSAAKLQGDFLACAYAAASPHVVIEGLEASSSADIPVQKVEAKIKGLQRIERDIGILAVQTPRSTRLRFLPSQNVRLTISEGLTADLPIASCPCDDRNLEFHVRRRQEDEFSRFLFDRNSLPCPVQIDGPWGAVEGNSIDSEFIYLAFDTWFAAAKSVIEQQLANESEYPMDLFWFAPEQDFYLRNLLTAWSDAFDSFRYQLMPVDGYDVKPGALEPVLSRYCPAQLCEKRVFVAGPDAFVHTVRQCLCEIGLPPDQIWAHSVNRGSERLDDPSSKNASAC